MDSLKNRILELKPILILLYLSFMGFLSVFAVQVYLRLEFEPLICLCSMGIIFGIYTSNRFTDMAEDFTNDIQKALFFQRRKAYYALAILALAASIGILLFRGKLHWLHFLLLGTGFCYSYKLVPWYSPARGLRMMRIKEMTFAKNLTVSFLWGGAVFAVPILYSTARVADTFVLIQLGLALFLSTLNNTLFDDILDVDGDRVAGIRTLPTEWGARNSMQLLLWLDLAWVGWIGFCLVSGRMDSGHSIFLSLLGAFPLVYMGLSRNARTPKALIDFLMESDLLFFSLGLILLGLI